MTSIINKIQWAHNGLTNKPALSNFTRKNV
jgi:hypothetical protein